MAHALQSPLHLFDYLEQEDARPVRHEFVDGSIHAMTGGTLRHNRIALNLSRFLEDRFEGTPCQVFVNDVKVHIEAVNSVYYPDVLVYYGAATAGGDKLVRDALLVIEITSESSEGVDRREKRMAYRKLPGLQAYWVVDQSEPSVEAHTRDAGGAWLMRSLGPADALAVPDAAELPVASLYKGTDIAV